MPAATVDGVRTRQQLVSLALLTALVLPGVSSSPTAAQEYRSPCVEIPADVDWVRKAVGADQPMAALGNVRLVLIDSRPRPMPTFGPFTQTGPAGSGPYEFHGTAMLSLLVDERVGLIRDHPTIDVVSYALPSGEKGFSTKDITAAIKQVIRDAGINPDNGKPTRTDPIRTVIAAPFAGGKVPGGAALTNALNSGYVLMAASAGNTNDTRISEPAAIAPVLAVGGLTPTGARWDEGPGKGSHTGTQLDVLAPGCQVIVSLSPEDEPASRVDPKPSRYPDRTIPANYYVANGTSEAATITAALAAKLWASQPDLHAFQLRRLLTASGGETHTKQRGFGAVTLTNVPHTTTVPTLTTKQRPTTVEISATSRTAPPLPGTDQLGPPVPQFAVSLITYRTDNGPWTQLAAPPPSKTFLTNGKCRQWCLTLPFPATARSLEIRTIDSDRLAALGGTWDNETAPFATTTVTRRTSASPPSSAPTAAFDAYRKSFAELATRLDTAIANLEQIAPPTLLITKRVSDALALDAAMRPAGRELCAVINDVRTRTNTWPGAPNHPPTYDPSTLRFICVPGLIGAGITYAMINGTLGTPIGDDANYQKDFVRYREWSTKLKTFST
jgi:hypothetical protein